MEYYLYSAETDDGELHFLSPLSEDYVFQRGLPGEAVAGSVEDPEDVSPDTFMPSDSFIEALQTLIARCGPEDQQLIDGATTQGEGLLYVVDGRHPSDDSNIPPENILGAFKVEEGLIVADSYEANPNHLLLTDQGMCVPPGTLAKSFVESLSSPIVTLD